MKVFVVYKYSGSCCCSTENIAVLTNEEDAIKMVSEDEADYYDEFELQ